MSMSEGRGGKEGDGGRDREGRKLEGREGDGKHAVTRI